LEDLGWKVLRFWEHDIDDALDAVVDQIVTCLG
jgi:very-short-patch-repair endonuclease